MSDTRPHPDFEAKRLSSNNDYYANVFKKTERMVSLVFYILSHIKKDDHSTLHLESLSTKALAVHEASLATLALYEATAPNELFPFQQSLAALEGSCRIANAARVMNDEVLALILAEIDLVQRFVRHHFAMKTPLALLGLQEDTSVVPHMTTTRTTTRTGTTRERTVSSARRPNTVIPQGDISSDAHFVYSQLVDRATRIKTVLEAKPEATIKDLAEVITDVSEKTIQRELNSLIEKGQVIRQGERRWSKYSIAK